MADVTDEAMMLSEINIALRKICDELVCIRNELGDINKNTKYLKV